MIAIRLFFLVCLLAGLAQAQTHRTTFRREGRLVKPSHATRTESDYPPLELENFTACPDTSQGKLVAITAEVVSVDAKRQDINLYDSRARVLLKIYLSELPKAQRRSLALDPVRRVSVYGNLEVQAGRCVIKAHKVVPILPDQAVREAGQ